MLKQKRPGSGQCLNGWFPGNFNGKEDQSTRSPLLATGQESCLLGFWWLAYKPYSPRNFPFPSREFPLLSLLALGRLGEAFLSREENTAICHDYLPFKTTPTWQSQAVSYNAWKYICTLPCSTLMLLQREISSCQSWKRLYVIGSGNVKTPRKLIGINLSEIV